MEEQQINLPQARKRFSIVGFVFTGLILSALLAQLLILLVGKQFQLTDASWWKWLQSSAPMYFVAFPLTMLLLHMGLPAAAPVGKNLTTKQFLLLIPICFCIMYGGSLVGTVLSLLLSGGTAENQVATFAMDQSLLKVLVMVILAPLLEELICRKMLLDRIGGYGEKLAVLVSGLVFGLLHQNFYQFFYAFGVGCIFGYIYLRTGKLRYTVLLHAIFNFVGSVVSPWILRFAENLLTTTDLEQITYAELATMLGSLLIMLTYLLVLFGVSIAGLVLLILKLRHITWRPAKEQLPKNVAFKTAFLNAGMITFGVVSLAMFIWALF